MAKFKAGDMVRRIITSNGWGDGTRLNVGDVVKVVSATETDLTVEINGKARSGNLPAYFELVEEAPKPTFKVGDRVRVTEIGLRNWNPLRDQGVDLGTVIVYNREDDIGVEFDKRFGGHDCGCGKNGHCWWLTDREIELVKDEPKTTPTPVTNINVTVNLYENACWYCRKGGLVDLYLAGAMGICPSCGRVCNNTSSTLFIPTRSGVIEVEPPKRENKPLTTEELKALPDGTRVFTLWIHGDEELWTDPRSCWREKRYNYLKRDNGSCGFGTNGVYYRAYLEEPERPY